MSRLLEDKMLGIKNIWVSLSEFKRYFENDRYNNYVFVEGIQDKAFYKGKIFSEDNTAFICNSLAKIHTDAEVECEDYGIKGGKRSVGEIASHLYRERRISNKVCKKNVVFIVDKDFDDMINLKKEFGNEVINLITVLPVYSIENYFIIKTNLKNVFERKLSSEELYELNKKLRTVHVELISYWAMKKWITLYYEKMKKSKISENFPEIKVLIKDCFSTKDDKDSIKRLFDLESRFISKLSNSEKDEYKKYKDEMINKIELIKGKDVFYAIEEITESLKKPIPYKTIYSFSNNVKIDLEVKVNYIKP